MPEEIRSLLVAGGRHEVLDQVTAPIDQTAVGAVDLADGGPGGDDPLEPGTELSGAQVFSHISNLKESVLVRSDSRIHVHVQMNRRHATLDLLLNRLGKVVRLDKACVLRAVDV